MNQPPRKPLMVRMLHNTSGRQNFRHVRPAYNNPSCQNAPTNPTDVIQQQTDDAIKTATENNSTDNKTTQ
ncbi:unnamed protein product [Adineta ricciae]|uniref:Uncharacterized protein n=1 Tax=Adineta ricciae TaxID=249248 RepID=A0A813SH38_ADIRI|nr:unnamed protein product [Adineta ricciae]CAF0844709.1 unnamed protein product [Adineta ricciae]